MAKPVEFKFKGQKEFARNFAKVAKQYPGKVLSGLFVVASKIMTISKRDHVPVDQGILKSSGLVEKPFRKGKIFGVVMAYGGAASAYALVQHENLSFQHTTGGPKYLERPLLSFPVANELAAVIQL